MEGCLLGGGETALLCLPSADGTEAGRKTSQMTGVKAHLVEEAPGLEEVELKLSNGGIDRNLPLDKVRKGGEGNFQVDMRTWALCPVRGVLRRLFISTFNFDHVGQCFLIGARENRFPRPL